MLMLLLSIIMCNNIPKPKHIKSPKRVGRGAAHRGRKSGKGSGGHKSRPGSHNEMNEGGQYPSYLRINKRGFHRTKNKKFIVQTSTIRLIANKNQSNHVTIDMIKKHFQLKDNNQQKIKVLFDEKIECTFEKCDCSKKASFYMR